MKKKSELSICREVSGGSQNVKGRFRKGKRKKGDNWGSCTPEIGVGLPQ
jgi:hypothetical protein